MTEYRIGSNGRLFRSWEEFSNPEKWNLGIINEYKKTLWESMPKIEIPEGEEGKRLKDRIEFIYEEEPNPWEKLHNETNRIMIWGK